MKAQTATPCLPGFHVLAAEPVANGVAFTQPLVSAHHYICASNVGDILSIQKPLVLTSIVNTFTATAALTAGQVVKIDTANPNSVVVASTADTGPGITIGIVLNSPASAGTAFVALFGKVASPVIGTGTCAIGNFVVVDTTTNGRVKCTATFAAGTVLGRALSAGAGVGTTLVVLLNLQ